MTVREMIANLEKLDPDGVLFLTYRDSYDDDHADTLDVPCDYGNSINGCGAVTEPALRRVIKENNPTKFYMITGKGE